MNRLSFSLFAVVLSLAACGRDSRLRTVDAVGVGVDTGDVAVEPVSVVERVGVVEPVGVAVDAGRLPQPGGCTVAFGGPDCCAADGSRVTAATCVDDAYVCSAGAVCSCHGEPQSFHCSDFCGSDAYVAPVCGAAGWMCSAGLIATSSCPPGTCWGEPGVLCAAGVRCVDARWVCADDDGGTHDPI